jgi:hypothetical protein
MPKAITAVLPTALMPAQLLLLGMLKGWSLERTQPTLSRRQAASHILLMIDKEGEP